jgi:FG-GAP repeat
MTDACTTESRWRPAARLTKALALPSALLLGIVCSSSSGIAAQDPPHPPNHITGIFWKQLAVVTPESGDNQLRAVAIDHSPGSVPLAAFSENGKVEIYSYIPQGRETKPSWGKDEERDGTYMSISSSRIAIGSPLETGGSVHVYARSSGGVWTAMGGALTPSVTSAHMDFGRPVELNGTTLVVGSPRFDLQGRAFVFELQNGQWVETAILGSDANQQFPLSYLGAALDVDGDVIVVGQTPEGDPGRVYVYEKQGGLWTLTTTILAREPANPALPAAPGDVAARSFGKAVALNGNQLAIRSNGYVQVFERVLTDGVWQWVYQDNYNVAASSSSFWYRPLVFNGANLLTGEYISPDVPNPPGRVHPLRGATARPLFPLISVHVDPDAKFIMEPGLFPNAQFGRSMALDKNWLIVGNHGHALIYRATVY